jgi:hypothetical protein
LSYRVHSKGSYGLKRIQRIHNRRSKRAKQIDEGLKAPIAKTPEQWMAQPNRFDFPDVDTPKKDDDLERQLEKHEANRLSSSHSHRRFRTNLNAHRLCGVTH